MRAVPALILAASCSLAAQAADTVSERSQQRARAILDRAVAAAGGEAALRGIRTVTVHADGAVSPRLQTPTVEAPHRTAAQREVLTLDLAGGGFRFEQRYDGFGLRNDYAITLDGANARLYDHLARTVAPHPADDAEDRRMRAQRRLPQLLLRQALDGAATLRHLGSDDFDGRPHEVISLVSGAQPLALYVDSRSGLVSKYEFLFSDPLASDEAAEIVFSDFVPLGGLMVPRRQTTRQAGETVAEWRLRTEVDAPSAAADFQARVAAYAAVPMPATPPSVTELGAGAYLFMSAAGEDYHTLVVEFADHLAVIDAPVSVAGSRKLIAAVKERFPRKPVRFVAVTHPHADHLGGLPGFAEEGATVVALPAHREVIERVAAGPGGPAAGRAVRLPAFRPVENGRLVLEDGSQRMELVNVGPLPHAQDILVAYLPAQRVVYQADLFFGSPTTFTRLSHDGAAAAEFAQKLRALGIDAATVAGAHGRTTAWQELAGGDATPAAASTVATATLGRELPPGPLAVVEARDAVELCQESVFPAALLEAAVPDGHRLTLLSDPGAPPWAPGLLAANPRFAGHGAGVFCFIEADFRLDGAPLYPGGRGAMAFWWVEVSDAGSSPPDPRYRGPATRAQAAYIYDAGAVDRALALAATPGALFGRVRMAREGTAWTASLETPDGRLEARLTPTTARTRLEYATPAYITVPWIDSEHADYFNVITYMGHHEQKATGDWRASGEALWARLFGGDPAARHRSMIQDGVSANLGLYRRAQAAGR